MKKLSQSLKIIWKPKGDDTDSIFSDFVWFGIQNPVTPQCRAGWSKHMSSEFWKNTVSIGNSTNTSHEVVGLQKVDICAV